MKWRVSGLAAVAGMALMTPMAIAQPSDFPIPAALSTELPAGIAVKKTAVGDVYVDTQGHTLYGLDRRAVVNRTTNPLAYCSGICSKEWVPVVPPAGTPAGRLQGAAGVNGVIPQQGAAGGAGAAGGRGGGAGGGGRGAAAPAAAQPDWTAVDTPTGPQLLYKATHLVFVRKDEAPGSVKWDGYDDMVWNALKYVPPVPKLTAPANVTPFFINGAYVMVDKDQRVLYNCAATCGRGVPFTTGFVSQGMGDWTVSRSGDSPQWLYKGKPVYISQGAPKTVNTLPAGATLLHP